MSDNCTHRTRDGNYCIDCGAIVEELSAPSGDAAPTNGGRFMFGAVEDWQRANKEANALGLIGRVDRVTHDPFHVEGKWISGSGGSAADEPLYESVDEAWEEARRKNMMSPLVEYARQLERALQLRIARLREANRALSQLYIEACECGSGHARIAELEAVITAQRGALAAVVRAFTR